MQTATTFMGLELAHPIVAAASPMSYEVDTIRQLEEGGASAVILHSLFEEQLQHEQQALNHFMYMGTESFAEATSYFPEPDEFHLGPDQYLEHIRAAKAAVKIPIIASLNGTSTGGWTSIAKQMQEAGADALELNIYYVPTNPQLSGSAVEQMYVDVVWNVVKSVDIPVCVKIGAQFTSPVNIAQRFREAGAAGLTLFNRFYQPDIDLDELDVKPNLVLSNSSEMRLPLRWIAIIHGRVDIEMAASTGIHSATDVAKMLLAGAGVTQICSAMLRYSPKQLGVLLRGLREWMETNEYESVTQMRGALSQKSCPEPAAFERANYMKTLQSYSPETLV